jgi:hypothetical protein
MLTARPIKCCTLALDIKHEGGSKEDRRLEEEDETCRGLKIGQSTKEDVY